MRRWWCLTTLCFVLGTSHALAGSILSFGAIGARSHQYNLLKIGQELVSTGHNFTLLVSRYENLNKKTLGKQNFNGLDIVDFNGPRELGTQEWFAQLPRDPLQVCNLVRSTSS